MQEWEGREGTDWLLSLEARALLAAVSLTAAWQRNLFHSKRCLNGTANSATTCRWQAAQLGNDGFNKSLMHAQAVSLSPNNMEGGEIEETERPRKAVVRCAQARTTVATPSNTGEERNERKGKPQIAPSARKTGCGKGTAVRDKIYAAIREQLGRL